MNDNDEDAMLISLDDSADFKNYITWVGPTDHTIRPATGLLREHLLRVREEIAQYEAWKKEQEQNGKTASANAK
ncbi:MAG TPA: hypothetical protein VE988_29330 [Gemmataceae bacterium]|nr:hypothetical protein [Gemmataceae bacterium]